MARLMLVIAGSKRWVGSLLTVKRPRLVVPTNLHRNTVGRDMLEEVDMVKYLYGRYFWCREDIVYGIIWRCSYSHT